MTEKRDIHAVHEELKVTMDAITSLRVAAHDPVKSLLMHHFLGELRQASTILQSTSGNLDRWARNAEKPEPDHPEAGHLARALR